LIFASVAED